jgi:hypothetical protein
VTIAIVGVVLVFAVQGLNNSMFQAANTRDLKVARELGLFKIAQFESGLYSEDIENHMAGDFSEQEYPGFFWEVVLGDEQFDEDDDEEDTGRFNSWAPDEDEEDEEVDEDAEEPFQELRVKVTFNGPKDAPKEVILERWVTWSFLYGEEETEDTDDLR